jgi:putative component of toxin-antitoxin plasmid stabilization module
MGNGAWTIDLYVDADGFCPVKKWLDSLSSPLRAAAVAAIELELAEDGVDVCRSSLGKKLGEGLYELRIARDAPTIARRKGKPAEELPPAEVLLRVFFATDGARIILLLSGYDKLADSKPRRQNKEIERARKLLKSYRLEKKRLDKAKRG